MPALDQERIGIVGLGAVGGSLALALGDRAAVLGWSRDAADRDGARAVGIPVCRAEGSSWVEEMRGSTVVLVAVPLDEMASVARQLLPRLPDESLVLHASSLQSRAALGLSEPEFRRILGTHPIAGSERSGFRAADPGMFRGATVRAEARATEADRARIEMVWRAAGAARIVWGEAGAHDELMSWISHLPQLAATALAAVLAQRGIGSDEVGPGARDATRLAASDPALWTPILQRAPHETVEALRHLTSTLDALGRALETHHAASLEMIWEQARAWGASAEEPA